LIGPDFLYFIFIFYIWTSFHDTTLNLAEMSAAKSRPSVPCGLILCYSIFRFYWCMSAFCFCCITFTALITELWLAGKKISKMTYLMSSGI